MQNHTLSDVATLALAKLARFSSASEQQVQQTFLFRARKFCGVRFESGSFQACWFFGDTSIQFTRGSQFVGEIPLTTGSTQRAA